MKEMRSATAILPSFKSGFLGECSNLKIVGSKKMGMTRRKLAIEILEKIYEYGNYK